MIVELGATTYTSVTWTSGDVITEAKMDAMVGNDQAYDSHASNGVLLNNAKSFAAKLSGGTNANVAFIDASNVLHVGDDGTNYLVHGTHEGWIDPEDTWTYASATTINIAAGGASRYETGQKIRFKQGGAYKYFYIVTVADQLLTVTGGDDYAVANSAITDNYYSMVANPLGFPQWFNYVPTYGGFSSDPTSNAKFMVMGKSVFVQFNDGGTSNAADFTVTLPIMPNNQVTAGFHSNPIAVLDNGSWQTVVGAIGVNAGVITAKLGKTIATVSGNTFGGFTASGNKYFQGNLCYNMA